MGERMSKEINKKIAKLNKKVDALIKKYKKQSEVRKKLKDQEFIAKIMGYYVKYENEDFLFTALDAGLEALEKENAKQEQVAKGAVKPVRDEKLSKPVVEVVKSVDKPSVAKTETN